LDASTSKPFKAIVAFYILSLLFSSIFFFGGTALELTRRVVFNLSMWGPGLAALTVCAVFYGSIRDLGWGWGKTRYQLVGLALPFVFCLATYTFIWFANLGGFEPIPSLSLSMIITGLLAWIIPVLGEEIGWRGFLVPELAKVTSFIWVGIISGLLWSTWHLAPILLANYGQGAPLWYTILVFFCFATLSSIPMAWLRLRSGSVWTAVLWHSANNYFVQSFFDEMTIDTGITHYLRGEFGIVTVVSVGMLTIIFYKKRHELRGMQ